MSTKISKIVIDVDSKKIELTAEQAKKMKGVLDELFGITKVVTEEHHHHHKTYPYYPRWWWDGNTVLCNNTQMTLNDDTVQCSL